jgi:hypothetical protein
VSPRFHVSLSPHGSGLNDGAAQPVSLAQREAAVLFVES